MFDKNIIKNPSGPSALSAHILKFSLISSEVKRAIKKSLEAIRFPNVLTQFTPGYTPCQTSFIKFIVIFKIKSEN
jgi:hypothetical protein